MPISFYYGAKDWMDPVPAMFLIEQKLVRDGAKLYFIDESDHHLYLDNPVDMVFKIALHIFGEVKAEEYRRSKINQGEAQLVDEEEKQLPDEAEEKEVKENINRNSDLI